ncbi:hypothetical protein AXF42_Ash002331 [Apostasia shenzhenica]|uniref:Uncharacterized protein n=1 Tax=Apostasia shenzhenica TaxID=1088818 RepID=A0A2I0AN83_9ASPA|nr:hypothetical protein AXF42_Ash002331 [Apostasia shenzhenica]
MSKPRPTASNRLYTQDAEERCCVFLEQRKGGGGKRIRGVAGEDGGAGAVEEVVVEKGEVEIEERVEGAAGEEVALKDRCPDALVRAPAGLGVGGDRLGRWEMVCRRDGRESGSRKRALEAADLKPCPRCFGYSSQTSSTMFPALPATLGTTFPSSLQTSMTMFLNYTYRCQRTLAELFPMQHASSSHANDCFQCSMLLPVTQTKGPHASAITDPKKINFSPIVSSPSSGRQRQRIPCESVLGYISCGDGTTRDYQGTNNEKPVVLVLLKFPPLLFPSLFQLSLPAKQLALTVASELMFKFYFLAETMNKRFGLIWIDLLIYLKRNKRCHLLLVVRLSTGTSRLLLLLGLFVLGIVYLLQLFFSFFCHSVSPVMCSLVISLKARKEAPFSLHFPPLMKT